MNMNFYAGIISFVVFAVILISFPFRRKKIVVQMGATVNAFSYKKITMVKSVVSIVLCGALICVLFFRNFSNVVNLIFCGCSILGCEISVRELICYKKDGVYENGIIVNGTKICFDEIYTVPELNLTEKESDDSEEVVISLLKKNKAKEDLVFNSPEERKIALSALKENI